jgi:hypothetical protein
MLGPNNAPFLKGKAAEIKSMLPFVLKQLETQDWSAEPRSVRAQISSLKKAGEGAVAFEKCLDANRRARDMPEKDVKTLFDSYHCFCLAYMAADGHLIPKCHLMYHLIAQAKSRGNPKFYATYFNESFNGFLAKICRNAHRRTMYRTVHFKLSIIRQLVGPELTQKFGAGS